MTRWYRCLLPGICLLSLACATGPKILASRDICHPAAERTTLVGLCSTGTAGIYQKCKVQVLEGDILCAQELWPRSGKAPQANGEGSPRP